MTIIVSILCNDGVVIGCDGMASNNLGVTNFVGVDNLKTEIINDKFIIACAGDDNLMTLFINFLKLSYDSFPHCNSSDEVAFSIVNGFREYCEKQYINPILNNSVNVVNNVPIILDPIKNQLINEFYKKISDQFQAIISFEKNGEHFIYSLQGFQPPAMMRDKGIWYKIIGSGMLIGAPSIHLIKKILNIKEKPNIDKAIQLVKT